VNGIGLRRDEGAEEDYFARQTRQNSKRKRLGFESTEDGSLVQPGSLYSSGRTLSSSRTDDANVRPPTPPIDYLALATAERRRSSFAPASTSPSFDSLRRRDSVLSSQSKVGFVGKGLAVPDITAKPSLIAEVDGLSSSSSRSGSREDSSRRPNSVGGGYDIASVRRDPTDMGTQLAIDAGITAHSDPSGAGKQSFAAYGRGHAKTQSSLGVAERPEIKPAQSGYFSSSVAQKPEVETPVDPESTPVAHTHTLSSAVSPTAGPSTRETRTVTSSPNVTTATVTSPMHIPPFIASTSPNAVETDIPPPCHPRKHRSGVLLSRVRAQTGGNPLAQGDSVDSGLVFGEGGSGRRGSQALGLEIEGDQGDERHGEDDFQGVDCSTSLDNA
jgi:hypothetical protein